MQTKHKWKRKNCFVHTYAHVYMLYEEREIDNSNLRKNGFELHFIVGMLANSKIIILSKVNQRRQIYDITYIWNLKKIIQIKLFRKQKQTHRHTKRTYSYQMRKGKGKG